MKAKVLHEVPDLEIEAEGYSTWQIENYRALSKKEHGPIFKCGGHPWFAIIRVFLRNCAVSD